MQLNKIIHKHHISSNQILHTKTHLPCSPSPCWCYILEHALHELHHARSKPAGACRLTTFQTSGYGFSTIQHFWALELPKLNSQKFSAPLCPVNLQESCVFRCLQLVTFIPSQPNQLHWEAQTGPNAVCAMQLELCEAVAKPGSLPLGGCGGDQICMFQVILCARFGMAKWPLQSLNNQLRDIMLTLNHLGWFKLKTDVSTSPWIRINYSDIFSHDT